MGETNTFRGLVGFARDTRGFIRAEDARYGS